MAFWLGINGFENRNTVRDRIVIVVSGPPSYQTTGLPTNSPSSACLSVGSSSAVRIPWYNDATGTITEIPTNGKFGFHGRYRPSSLTANLSFGLGRGGNEYIAVGNVTTTGLWTLRVAGAVRATAGSNPFQSGIWERIHIVAEGKTAGSVVRVYRDGNMGIPLLTYTLVSGDETALAAVGLANEFRLVTPGGGGQAFDDCLCWNPDATTDPEYRTLPQLGQPGIAGVLFTGNGAEQGFTGGFGAIDEVPASDADKVTATAVNAVSTYTKAALGAANVFGVKAYARVTRTGTDAGSSLRFKAIDGANTLNGPSMPAPADGDLMHIFPSAPDGSPSSPTNFDSARFGFESLT